MLFQTAGPMNNMTILEKKYYGLIVCNKKLGCNHCAKPDSLHKKGYHVSLEWKNCSILASEKDSKQFSKHLFEKN